MRLPAASAALFCAALLAACTPDLNWREVQLPPTPLQALLPCKPDEGERPVLLAGLSVRMHMLGCDAAGATFTVAWVEVAEPAQLGAVLGAWQDASLARMGLVSGPDAPAGRAFVPAGAIALPQSVRLAATGRRPDEGGAVSVQAAWFASTRAGKAYAYQAAMYSPRVEPATAENFLAGLHVP
ncbi:hypothetical protein [Xylophilus sp. ASV27]|uniref:hypothetical protein n=1 Tax=Xylophilus sp. ASV27 TaxID=2795129 RepID=UPI0018EB61D3|nr:hypothetical protein [Xylophilus sp. ASV27]